MKTLKKTIYVSMSRWTEKEYTVTKAVNTLTPVVNSNVTAAEVQALIDGGTEVVITPCGKK